MEIPGSLKGVRVYQQVVLSDVEEMVLQELMDNPMTLEELMSISSLVEKLGPLDYSILPDFVKSMPFMDAPKRMMVKNVVEMLERKGLVKLVDGRIEITDYGKRYITGESTGTYVRLVTDQDGWFILKPYVGVIYELQISADVIEPGLYTVNPLIDLGVMESVVPVLKDHVDTGVVPVKVLLLENTVKIRSGTPVLLFEKLCTSKV